MTDTPPDAEATQLWQYVKAPSGDPYAAAAQASAAELVDHHIGETAASDGSVPKVIRWAAILEVGADLYHRRSARNGLATFGTEEIQTARIRTDPLAAARPILAPYLGPGIA